MRKDVISLTTYEWEELMLAELSKELNLDDKIVVSMFATILLNEVQALTTDQPSVLLSLLNDDAIMQAFQKKMADYVNLSDDQKEQLLS